MKGWWVRYKFCTWRVDGVRCIAYARRGRALPNFLGGFGTFGVATRLNYLRGLLKGLSRRRPASPQKTRSRARASSISSAVRQESSAQAN